MTHHPESESLPLLLLFSPSSFLEVTLTYVLRVLKPSLILPVARVYEHSLPKTTEKKYRLLSIYSTTVSYWYVLYLHSTECFTTGKRGLDGNCLLYEYVAALLVAAAV